MQSPLSAYAVAACALAVPRRPSPNHLPQPHTSYQLLAYAFPMQSLLSAYAGIATLALHEVRDLPTP
eukprot:1921144-Rhodomonas_salina.1